ncbi:MAG: 6-carboxytetrahydropterin synthase [Cyclobacteriaceae bacterium]|nr:6-carboxytetrahydropterin synthase [Cyclobacteriaceae bacterium]
MKALVYISRLEHFNAAHKLYNTAWSKDKNIEIFGKCANENWHGHNFELTVTVKGAPDPETGFVVDFKKLGMLIREEVIEKVDHKNLNVDVDFLVGKMATCEVFAVEIWKILEEKLAKSNESCRLHCIKLVETPGNYAEYYGESI